MRRLVLGFCGLSVAALCLAGTPPASQTDFFVQNEGQWDGAFSFRYEGSGATYYLTATGMTIDLHESSPRTPPSPEDDGRHAPSATFLHEAGVWPSPYSIGGRQDMRFPPVTGGHRGVSSLAGARGGLVKGHVLRLSFLNANPSPQLIGEDKLSSYSNYFLSRDSCKWRSRVGHFQRVIARDVWPGIDVEYASNDRGVETIYHIHPFADASLIQLRYEGQDAPLAVDANRCLQLQTSLGIVAEQAPFAYQDVAHHQEEIACHYEITDQKTYRLALGPYDATHEVMIDPQLVYSSYWGSGAWDDA